MKKLFVVLLAVWMVGGSCLTTFGFDTDTDAIHFVSERVNKYYKHPILVLPLERGLEIYRSDEYLMLYSFWHDSETKQYDVKETIYALNKGTTAIFE